MSEWTEVFSGHDLSGWVGLDGAAHEWDAVGAVALRVDDRKMLALPPGAGVMVNGVTGRTVDILTEQSFGDCELHLEFIVPEGSNSGVYFMGHYEIQILDSWGVTDLKYSACGGVYCRWIDKKPVGGTPPRVNASRPPGEWQDYDVIFRAPKFDDLGKKIANARFEKIVWNGEVVHEDVEVEGPTRGPRQDLPEQTQGPLMLQGDHGPVAYRNIRLREPG
jgi:hypothetical protein